MRSSPVAVVRRLAPALFVLVLASTLFVVAQRPSISAAHEAALASQYRFTEVPIALPANLPQKSVRVVNPRYKHIRSWISSVGAAISVNDLDGRGVANDLCLVDTRSDAAIVTPAPVGGDSYPPFVLDPAPLPMSDVIAPMGCVPGDYNGDGWNDLLVYYWGRTPVVFLHRGQPGLLTLASYQPTELIAPSTGPGGTYQGKQWNTNAVAVADFDGDGHPDIGVFNYFPESGVLDPHGQPNVQMNHSHVAGHQRRRRAYSALDRGDRDVRRPSRRSRPSTRASPPAGRWAPARPISTATCCPSSTSPTTSARTGCSTTVSTPGDIKFDAGGGRSAARSRRSPWSLGHDSFKGMSHRVRRPRTATASSTCSSATSPPRGVWRRATSSGSTREAAPARRAGEAGHGRRAVHATRPRDLDMAWTGWGWDAKMADFDNSGHLAIVQTYGFVKGTINRWSLAAGTGHEQRPDAAEPGDVAQRRAGRRHRRRTSQLAFWVRDGSGRYVNLSAELGLDVPIPTRGVAVADTDGDGGQDFAVARQWGAAGLLPQRQRRPRRLPGPAPVPASGSRRRRQGGPVGTPGVRRPGPGDRPPTGTRQIAQLDGGGGHSGKRSFDVVLRPRRARAGSRVGRAQLARRERRPRHQQT